MTSRADMKADILADLDRSTSSDGAFVLKAIAAAIRYYQPKRFFFNESRTTTFNTAADTASYTFETIGATFYAIDGAFLTDGDIYELARGDYRAAELSALDTTARPTEYAYFNETLFLTPIPDAAYAVRVTGHVRIDAPDTDDEDGNEWFETAYDLIKYRAKAFLYANVYTDEVGLAQVMRIAEAEELRALQQATGAKVAPGYLTATEF